MIAALFCVVVYWVKPEGMVAVTLFGAFAALPQGLHIGKVFGPVVINAYHLTAVLAICYLIPAARLRFSDYVLPGIFTLAVVFATVLGFETGSDPKVVIREATTMLEMVVGFVMALFIVYGGYLAWTIRVTVVILWFSAGLAIVSSLHAIRLAGRAESLAGATGAGQALRIILTTQSPATAVLSALVAGGIMGRVSRATFFALGPPALIISLLSFSRNTLISMAVAAAVALLASWGWPALRRLASITAISGVFMAVTIPGSLFFCRRSEAGAWLGDQFSAFNQRVLGGVSSSALEVDESTLERLREDALLNAEIARAPMFGHGLGYAYQQPNGTTSSPRRWCTRLLPQLLSVVAGQRRVGRYGGVRGVRPRTDDRGAAQPFGVGEDHRGGLRRPPRDIRRVAVAGDAVRRLGAGSGAGIGDGVRRPAAQRPGRGPHGRHPCACARRCGRVKVTGQTPVNPIRPGVTWPSSPIAVGGRR